MTLNARRLGWRNSRWNQFSPIAPQDYCRRELEYQTSVVRPARQRNETEEREKRRDGERSGARGQWEEKEGRVMGGHADKRPVSAWPGGMAMRD